MFHLSIKGYAETRPHRSYCFLSMFKLHCKRHYRNLATYSWCTTWREHVTKTAPARRRPHVGVGGGAQLYYIHKSCQAARIDNRLSYHQASGHAAAGAWIPCSRYSFDIAVNDNCRLMTITTAYSPRPLDDSPPTDTVMFHASVIKTLKLTDTGLILVHTPQS